MDRGVILLAIGDTAYGKFAANMAISIKEFNKNIPIQLIYEKQTISHLTDWHLSFFDELTLIENADCYQGKKIFPALAKISIYKYAKFYKNIYLDVDGICLKNIDSLFNKCEDGYFFSQVVGKYIVEKQPKEFPEMQWCKPDVLINHFGLNEGDIIPALNTSFQYFKKCKESELLFNTAKESLLNGISDDKRWFKWGKDNHQPDELYMNIALAKLKLFPELNPPKIIFFDNKKMKNIAEVENNYYVLGLYGGIQFTHSSLQDYYDRLMERICIHSHGKNHNFKCANLMRRKIS